MMALGGSFRIEHTNAEWELFRSEFHPDERGIVRPLPEVDRRTDAVFLSILQKLYHLSCVGDVPGIEEIAEGIGSQYPEHATLAAKILELAQQYQSDRISETIVAYAPDVAFAEPDADV